MAGSSRLKQAAFGRTGGDMRPTELADLLVVFAQDRLKDHLVTAVKILRFAPFPEKLTAVKLIERFCDQRKHPIGNGVVACLIDQLMELHIVGPEPFYQFVGIVALSELFVGDAHLFEDSGGSLEFRLRAAVGGQHKDFRLKDQPDFNQVGIQRVRIQMCIRDRSSTSAWFLASQSACTRLPVAAAVE